MSEEFKDVGAAASPVSPAPEEARGSSSMPLEEPVLEPVGRGGATIDTGPSEEDLDALGAEDEAIEAASARPAVGTGGGAARSEGADGPGIAMVALVVLVVLFLAGGISIYNLRKDFDALSARFTSVEAQVDLARRDQSRAAIRRAIVELAVARELRPDGAREELDAMVERLDALTRDEPVPAK